MSMAGVEIAADMRERAIRWIEDGQNQLGTLLGVLNDYDRLRDVADSAERECDRLREFVYENERLKKNLETTEHECEQLREAVRQLRAETERHCLEREGVAESLSHFMNEVLLRLRPQEA